MIKPAEKSLKKNAIAAFVLAIPSQIISICVPLALIIGQQKITRFSLGLLLMVGCAFIASVNSTRVLDADLYNYSQRSLDLLELNGIQALEYSPEFVYYFLNWFAVRVLGLDFLDFFLLINFLTYLLSVKAIEYLSSMQQKTIPLHYTLTCGLLFLTSPVLFEQSSHLVRQYFAMSLMLFSFSRMLSGRNSLIWVGLALFTHVSSAIFLLAWVPMIKTTRNNLFLQSIFHIIILSLLILSIPQVVSILSSLTGLGYFAYGDARFGEGLFAELNPLGFAGKFVIWIHLFLSISLVLKGKSSLSQNKITSVAIAFLLIDSAILISDTLNFHEISVRFAQFVYFTLPILFLMSHHVSPWITYLCATLVFFQVSSFLLRGSNWEYSFDVLNMFLPAYMEFFI